MVAEVRYRLDRPLPQEVVAAAGGWLAYYRRYPVFSWAWFVRRTAVFGSVALLIGLLSGSGVAIGGGSWASGSVIALYTAATFGLMVTAGPGLATLVRHARFAGTTEGMLVVAAVLIGVALSYLADQWTSDAVARLAALPPKEPPPMAATIAGKLLGYGVALFIYGGFGGGMALRAYFTERTRWGAAEHQRELAALQLRKTETDSKLAVLQAQVEPHFLFNTLASVRSLVRADPARAEAMIETLTEYLRATIPQFRGGEAAVDVTLGRQLDIAESYLKLMSARMGPRLTFTIEAHAEVRALDFPPLMLISLVENAIKHGVEPKTGPARVDIRARRVSDGAQNWLEVVVEDDGVGLQPGVGTGVGLSNVREQLKARFGSAAVLRVEGRVTGGVVAAIRVPA